jgi:hypothetical protein
MCGKTGRSLRKNRDAYPLHHILSNKRLVIVRSTHLVFHQSPEAVYSAVMEYVYLVPHVEEADYLFLKTIIPSRKATRDYGRKDKP